MASSAGVVYTGLSGNMSGDGHGAGAVLQNNSAAINQNNIDNALKQSQIELQRQKLAKEKADAQIKQWDDIQPKVKEGVWSVEKPKIDKALIEFSDEAATLFEEYVKTGDPNDDPMNPYSEAGKYINSKKAAFEDMQAQAIESEKFMADTVDFINKDGGKYDKGYTAEYFKEYTDPKTTSERRQQMRREKSPVKLNFDDESFDEALTPDDSDLGDGYRGKDPRNVEITFNSMAATPQGRQQIDSGKLDGETDEAFLARRQARIQAKHPKQKIKVAASNKSDNNNDGTDSKKPKYTIDRDANNEPIAVTLSHAGEAQFKDESGNFAIYKLISIKKNVNGDWRVLAKNTAGEEVSLPFDGSAGNKNGTHNYEKFKELTGEDFLEGVYGGSKGGAAKPSGNTASPKTNITYNEWKKSNPNGTFSQYKAANK